MQMATVEFARDVLDLKNAHSTEMLSDTPYPVIDMMEALKRSLASHTQPKRIARENMRESHQARRSRKAS